MGTTPNTARYASYLPLSRVFGDDLAFPRPLYFTYIPAVLIFAGGVSWVLSSDTGLVLGCVTATLVSIYTLWQWLFRRAPTRFSTLLAMFLLLGYGGGALNTWITLPRGSLTLGQAVGSGHGVLARGIAGVLFSSAVLYFLGELFEKPLYGQSFRLHIDERTRSLIYFSALAMAGGYATHVLVIGGAAAAGGHVSIPGLFLAWIYPPIAALSVAAFLTAKVGSERLLTGISSLTFLLMFAVNGRRASVYTTIEILFVLSLAGYRWRKKGIRSLLLIFTLGAVIVACSLVFMLLRIAPVALTAHKEPTAVERFQAADRLVKRGDAINMAAAATRQNVRTRTLILTFLANILDATSTRTPALGHDALSLLESTIPSAIYPDKDRFFSEERLVDQQFGFSYSDEANSVLTAGATDFGILGMIFYPLVLVLLARVVYEMLSGWFTPLPLLVVSLAFVYLFVQTEAVLSGYLSDIRNAIIFGIIIQIFVSFPRLRLHPQYMDRRV
jgi:hypothetical protein